MKRNTILSIVLVLFLQFSLHGAEGERVGAVLKLKGKVEYHHAGERDYSPAYMGQMLLDGDWIKTGEGDFIAIIFLDGTQLKLSEEAELELKSDRINAREQNTELFLEKGELYTKVQKQKRSSFSVATPVSVAAVKGTEFNLSYDETEKSSELFVFEGAVEFTNELGKILAKEMTYSMATLEKAPSKAKKMKSSDAPDWQEKTAVQYGFKLIPEKSGSLPLLQPVKVSIQVMDMVNGQNANAFSGPVDVTVQDGNILLSADGSSWADNVQIQVSRGKGSVSVKSSRTGAAAMVVGSDDTESRKLDMDFRASKQQRSQTGGKLNKIIEKQDMGDIGEKIEGKELTNSKVSGSSATVDDMLQKVDSGEYEIVDIITVQNEDGSVSVKLKVKPRKK